MRVVTFLLTMFFAAFTTPNANSALIIMSGLDDTCEGCTLNDRFGGAYVNPNGTPLNGAAWIQDPDVWREFGTFKITETDLENSVENFIISSLFVSFDDALLITSGNQTLFDSNDYNFRFPWKSTIDVIALTGELFINATNGLSFLVDNVNSGATGVIWRGELKEVDVSAPSVMGLFGICIALVCTIRRRRS